MQEAGKALPKELDSHHGQHGVQRVCCPHGLGLAESEAGQDASTSAARLKAARAELAQFIRETGTQPDSARTSVYGFGHSAAGKAAWAAKRAEEKQQSFQQILYLEPQPVTMESIRNVKAFRCETLDESGQARLKNRHKQLLMAAKGKKLGTEMAQEYRLDMNPLTGLITGPEQGGTVKLPDQNVPYVAIHTHPSCGIFSPADLSAFVKRENLKLLTAIGNNGHIYAIEKTERLNNLVTKKSLGIYA